MKFLIKVKTVSWKLNNFVENDRTGFSFGIKKNWIIFILTKNGFSRRLTDPERGKVQSGYNVPN